MKANSNDKRKGGSGFKHSKRLGQNFLTDYSVVGEIVDGSDVDEDTLVIEIGPGEGVLTEALADRAGHVIAIELDDRLIPVLRVRLYDRDNVEIIHGDVLETDLKGIISDALAERNLSAVRIVGNLPYYITTPIIMKLLEENIPADSITVMVQKEVGERLIAEPGGKKTGAISYTVHYYCETRGICDVGRECFDPVPKVDSMVIRLDRREAPPVECRDADRMFRCVKAGFMMRRKTLVNALAQLGCYSRDELIERLEAAGIEPGRRAESLTLEEFARLSNELDRA